MNTMNNIMYSERAIRQVKAEMRSEKDKHTNINTRSLISSLKSFMPQEEFKKFYVSICQAVLLEMFVPRYEKMVTDTMYGIMTKLGRCVKE